ncbi:MAG TPA: HAMP domain-containing methyl-accepting chemotaxis protein [Candidatus Dormibacteraeota bacterium]
MELKRPPTNVVVLRPSIPDSRVDRVIVDDLKPWDSFFLLTVGASLVVVIPFFVLLAFFDAARLGSWVGIGALLAIVGLLTLSTWLTARPVLALSRAAADVQSGDSVAHAVPGGGLETRRLAVIFNSMVDRVFNELPRLLGEAAAFTKRLSASAEQLATAAAGQSEAAARTSAGLEELAISSALIASSVGGVVTKAEELRANIQRAHTDLQASSDRTQANARRVDEIRTVLEVLNDIADQTALLALNAAIEAARAGESGRGFAVVADEVRRLAERSKAAAAQIAKLTEEAQTTSGEAVVAIERRGQQLTYWMTMTEAMAEVSAKVQPAVMQQNSATSSVRLAIQLIADHSVAVEAAAQEVLSTATAQTALAADFRTRRWIQEESL